MEQLLLLRELGSIPPSKAELYRRTQLLAALHVPQNHGEEVISFTNPHKAGVNALALETQEGQFLLSGGASGNVCIWDIHTPPVIHPTALEPSDSSRKHSYGVTSICYYPQDRDLFITSSYDKTVNVWGTSKLNVAHTFKLGSAVHQVDMAPHGTHVLVAAACHAATIRLLDLRTAAWSHTLNPSGGGAVMTVAWSPRDENILASGDEGGAVRLWDIRKAASCLAILDMRNSIAPRGDWKNRAHEGAVNGLTWTEDGASLISLGTDEKLRVWNILSGKNTLTNFEPVIRNKQSHFIKPPVITPLRHSHPQTVFVASQKEVIGFDILEGNVRVKLSPAKANINALILCPNPFGLLYGASNGDIGFLGPSLPSVDDANIADLGEGQADENVLDSIYRSLVETPITFS